MTSLWEILTSFELGSMAEWTEKWKSHHSDLREIRNDDERYMFIAKKIQIGWSDHSTDIFGRTNSYHRLVSRVWSDWSWTRRRSTSYCCWSEESTWSEWDGRLTVVGAEDVLDEDGLLVVGQVGECSWHTGCIIPIMSTWQIKVHTNWCKMGNNITLLILN